MRLVILTIAVTLSAATSAFATSPPSENIPTYQPNYSTKQFYITPDTAPQTQPCFDYGQLTKKEEVESNPFFCTRLREARDEGRVPVGDFYALADNYQIDSPVYGCNISKRTTFPKVPTICEVHNAPQNKVFAFTGPNRSGHRSFDGKPLVVAAGEEQENVRIRSFTLGADTAVVAFTAPDFQGDSEEIKHSGVAPFMVKSFNVVSTQNEQ